MQEKVVIVSFARTPFGSFQGKLSSLSAPSLASYAITFALKKAAIQPEEVTNVVLGNVLSSGLGQAPARQASIFSKIPHSIPAMGINKVCGSALAAIEIGMQSLLVHKEGIVVAGGMESMSKAPYLISDARKGMGLGHQKMVDSMIFDALWDPYHNLHMGECAEKCAEKYSLSRQMQDAYAIASYTKAQKAQKEKKFSDQIAPVTIQHKKTSLIVQKDEEIFKADFAKIPKLKPVFKVDGTITAANASSINDGAAICILTTEKQALTKQIPIQAKIVSIASHSMDPILFTEAPVEAIRKALKKANWKIDEADLFEINEAFAVVPLLAQKKLHIPEEKLNIWGGAISIGHPIGASGARILMNLIAALKDTNKRRGVAAICIGGGEALAICLEVENKR